MQVKNHRHIYNNQVNCQFKQSSFKKILSQFNYEMDYPRFSSREKWVNRYPVSKHICVFSFHARSQILSENMGRKNIWQNQAYMHYFLDIGHVLKATQV